MRLLHTSDWHLGRSLHGASLRDAQAAHLAHLAEVVRAERVDAVLVAGDVYDRALPPVEAVEVYTEGIALLQDAGAQVIAISGNHDSAVRLGVNARSAARGGLHLRTDPRGAADPVLLADGHGPVAVYALPYLEPATTAPLLAPAARPTQAAVLGGALAAVAADRARRPGVRTVGLAHAWVAGAQASDSEREIGVGGLAQVPTTLFHGLDYTALGHLHGPQVLVDGLRYSGSPLAFSFGEARHVKGSWLVELGAHGLARVEAVPAPVPRRLARVAGHLDALLTDPAHAPLEACWLDVTLTDPAMPTEAMRRLHARFPHALHLAWEPEGPGRSAVSYATRLAGRTDGEVCRDFVEHVRRSPATEGEVDLLDAALEAGRRAVAAG